MAWPLLVAAAWLAAAPAATAPSEVLTLSREFRVRLDGGRDLVLEVRPREGETAEAVAQRAAGTPAQVELLLVSLKKPSGRSSDGFYRVPLALLSGSKRAFVLRNVFPQDTLEGDDWIHVAKSSALPVYDEGLWQVASWFTGDGARFKELLVANALDSPELSRGQQVRIPAAMLDRALRRGTAGDDVALAYGKDDEGEYASYVIKPGEALYSAVVLRYTGRVAPDDVDAVAKTIARRSGIKDVTDIPAGWEIRIPLDALEPEFLPRDDPRRKTVEKQAAAVQRELVERPQKPIQRGLKGVVVIVDPGHGGMDPGTTGHGLFEHDYVFDVASRLKRDLEAKTAAKVYLTLDDPVSGAVPSSGDAIAPNRKRTVLTSPAFLAAEDGETAVAVNLRWYLANSLFRKLVKAGTDPDKIVFLSLHADARHPSLRGAMVYVPGSTYRKGTMGSSDPTYLQFKEVREMPRVSFSQRDRLRSEAVSRKLAGAIVQDLKKDDLPVQPFQPVRDRVIRGGEIWLPAVLKGNAVPAKVLVEMVNLNNADDAALLAHAADRDRLAASLSDALATYFGKGGRGSGKGK
ncbi:MAG TPA: N-acetylmuramoyl-L-alanine amidase [Candidatus Polarisedimenticolaceae bacterium]|nr:N-acetylmuramoyl-L-alanine amidase [Candidatus Polarisedimenticolaceae bacterium]